MPRRQPKRERRHVGWRMRIAVDDDGVVRTTEERIYNDDATAASLRERRARERQVIFPGGKDAPLPPPMPKAGDG